MSTITARSVRRAEALRIGDPIAHMLGLEKKPTKKRRALRWHPTKRHTPGRAIGRVSPHAKLPLVVVFALLGAAL